METKESILQRWMGLGGDPQELTLLQLVLRAIIVFLTMYFMIRIAGRRFMEQKNVFDVVLAFLVASMLARAINCSASFWANTDLGFVIALTYRAMARLACEFLTFGTLLKERAIQIIVKSEVKNQFSHAKPSGRHDLEEALRFPRKVGDPKAVKLARLERSGKISVERKPQILDVAVGDGVMVIEPRIQ